MDTLVSAGYMRVLGEARLRDVPRAAWLNVHPALLPAFPGGHAVRDALAWGAKVTGVTVHLVDEEVDHGPIVAAGGRRACRDDDDWDSLELRIHEAEHRLLPRAVRALMEGRLRSTAGRCAIERIDMSDVRPVRRALLAVYDKGGLVEFARGPGRAGREPSCPRAARPRRSRRPGCR